MCMPITREDLSKNYFNNDFLLIFHVLGYEFDREGMCAGISYAVAEACALAAHSNDLSYVAKWSEFFCGVQEIANKVRIKIKDVIEKEGEIELTDDKTKVIFLEEFEVFKDSNSNEEPISITKNEFIARCDKINIYQDPGEYQRLHSVDYCLNQFRPEHIEQTFNLAQSLDSEQLGGLHLAHVYTGVYTTEELSKFMTSFEESVRTAELPCHSLTFSSENHQITAVYIPREKEWYVYNHSSFYSVSEGNKAAEAIKNSFYNKKENKFILQTSVVTIGTEKENTESPSVRNLLNSWEKNECFQEVQKITPDKARYCFEGPDHWPNWLYVESVTGKDSYRVLTELHPALKEAIKEGNLPNEQYKTMCADSLLDAASYGNNIAVECLVTTYQAPINNIHQYGLSALHYAANEGYTEVISTLLAAGVDANKITPNGNTPLYLAVTKQRITAAKELLKYPQINLGIQNNEGNNFFHITSNYDNTELISLALAGKPKEERSRLLDCLNNENHSPAIIAASLGNVGMLDRLVNEGADINFYNSDGNTALYLLIVTGRYETAIHLLTQSYSDNNLEIQAPLCAAIRKKSERTTKLLLDKGAKINEPIENGLTAFNWAVTEGCSEIVDLMIWHKKIDLAGTKTIIETDAEGNTVLHNLSKATVNWKEHSDLVEKITSAGVDVNAKNQQMKTALDLTLKRCIENSKMINKNKKVEYYRVLSKQLILVGAQCTNENIQQLSKVFSSSEVIEILKNAYQLVEQSGNLHCAQELQDNYIQMLNNEHQFAIERGDVACAATLTKTLATLNGIKKNTSPSGLSSNEQLSASKDKKSNISPSSSSNNRSRLSRFYQNRFTQAVLNNTGTVGRWCDHKLQDLEAIQSREKEKKLKKEGKVSRVTHAHANPDAKYKNESKPSFTMRQRQQGRGCCDVRAPDRESGQIKDARFDFFETVHSAFNGTTQRSESECMRKKQANLSTEQQKPKESISLKKIIAFMEDDNKAAQQRNEEYRAREEQRQNNTESKLPTNYSDYSVSFGDKNESDQRKKTNDIAIMPVKAVEPVKEQCNYPMPNSTVQGTGIFVHKDPNPPHFNSPQNLANNDHLMIKYGSIKP